MRIRSATGVSVSRVSRVSRVSCALALLAAVPARPALAATILVGPTQTYKTPCAGIAAAAAGDTVQVDAGTYNGDTCAWSTDNLTVTAVNGRAKIDLTGVNPAQQKGIFTIAAPTATIENFELSGAAISSAAGNNGAGIRHQGLNLTVRNCFIHDNQDGILGAPSTAGMGAVDIENTELSSNGAGDGFSHNAYIGDYASFTFRFSYSHQAKVGHLLKSRAYTTSVLYSRLTDEPGGTASYEVDIPNGGTAFVIGNLIEQSATSQNPNIISFGEEGAPSGYDTHLFVVNNTVLNDLASGTFVADPLSTPAVVTNNIFYGGGTPSSQAAAVLTSNFTGDPKFVSASTYDVELSAGSGCIDQGTSPGTGSGTALTPAFEYVHPLGDVARTVVGAAIDIGAYEYGLSVDAGAGGADAGPPGSGSGSAGSGSGTGHADAGGSGTGSGSGSASGAGKDGGATGTGSGTSDAGLQDAGSAAGSSGGCGCGVAGTPARRGGLGAVVMAVGLALVVRRRRRVGA